MKKANIPLEARVALIYLLFSFLWIILSDQLLASLISDPITLTAFQTYKGWFFISMSALLIYVLLRRGLKEQRRLDTALRENEERYRLLFNTSLDAILLSDPTGVIYAANPAACRCFGYRESEMLQLNRNDLVDVNDQRLTLMLEHRARDGYHLGELEFIRKDGTKFTGEIATALYTDHLHHERTSLIIRDITERKQAERDLRISESNLQKAQVVANMGNWTWHIDTNRLEWSDQMYHIFGIEKASFTGNLPDVIAQAIHPDDRAAVEQCNAAVVNDKNLVPLEYRILWADGSVRTVWAEAGELVLDSAGKPLRLTGIVQDITERKEAEKRLRDSEERLRLALTAAQQGIYDLNVQTGEAVVNDIYATMLGYDPRTFVETSDRWIARLHPDERDPVGKAYRDYIGGESSEYRVEFRQQTAGGGWKWILSIGRIVERDQQGQPLRMLGTHTDITYMKLNAIQITRLLEESQRRLQRIGALREIDMAISSNMRLTTTLDVLLRKAKEQLRIDAAAVLIFDDKKNTFHDKANLGFVTNAPKGALTAHEESLACAVFNPSKAIHARITKDEDAATLAITFPGEGFQAFYGVPLVAKGKTKGILEIFSRSKLTPDIEWLDFLETLAGQAAVAIENYQLIEGLQFANEELLRSYDATIEGWSLAMDLRDKETEGHTLRVTEMTLDLARKLSLSEEEIVHIRRGALLHDIGKMGIPDAILLKQDILTKEEFHVMQEHPKYAYDMLQSIEYLRPALEIPHLHHEKWDGTGYPYGLEKEEIPIAARLFAVVDVYDALTSDRPYRAAWSKQDAIQYLIEQKGKHFDSRVVDAFLEILEK